MEISTRIKKDTSLNIKQKKYEVSKKVVPWSSYFVKNEQLDWI
jgi:hypothetical protein